MLPGTSVIRRVRPFGVLAAVHHGIVIPRLNRLPFLCRVFVSRTCQGYYKPPCGPAPGAMGESSCPGMLSDCDGASLSCNISPMILQYPNIYFDLDGAGA